MCTQIWRMCEWEMNHLKLELMLSDMTLLFFSLIKNNHHDNTFLSSLFLPLTHFSPVQVFHVYFIIHYLWMCLTEYMCLDRGFMLLMAAIRAVDLYDHITWDWNNG